MPTPGLCGINWLAQAQAAQLYDCRGVVMLVIEEGQGQDGLAAPCEPLSLAPWLLFFLLFILILYGFQGRKPQTGSRRWTCECSRGAPRLRAASWRRNGSEIVAPKGGRAAPADSFHAFELRNDQK